MFQNTKISLKYCGFNVEIRPLANLVKPEMIEVDDDAKIDDFTHINGGIGIRIGKNVHIACFCSIAGGGELIIGDNVKIGYGSKIITADGSHNHGTKMTTDALEKRKTLSRNITIIEKGVSIGCNVVIHPNVKIGEGAVICDHCQIMEDVESWSTYQSA